MCANFLVKQRQVIKLKYEIGERIRKYREACGMNQMQLAEKLGINNSRVSNWEQGINRPDADILADICRALDFPPVNYWMSIYPQTNWMKKSGRLSRRIALSRNCSWLWIFYWELPNENALDNLEKIIITKQQGQTGAVNGGRSPFILPLTAQPALRRWN